MIITPSLIVFLIIVFIALFLFLNTIDRRKWLTGIIALLLTPIAYFYVFYPFINIISNYHHQKYFNSELWVDNPSLRYEMMDHMITSDTLIGLTKRDIENRLGTYEWLSWNDVKKQHDSTKWNYGLGIEPGAFNKKKECIEIIFKNNTVATVVPYQEIINYDKAEE